MRLVDLDGKTWDGTQLNSKYRPMYDAQGRNEMMAITMGWLIDAPKFDLDQHDAEVRAEAIDELMEVVKSTYHNFCGFDLERMTKYGNENASQLEQSYSTMMMYEIASEFDDLIDALEQLKAGGNHGK